MKERKRNEGLKKWRKNKGNKVKPYDNQGK